MSNIVNTKYGDRGLVHLPPVALDGSKTPTVRTLAPTTSRVNSKVPPPPTQSTAIRNYQPLSTYRSNWQSFSVVPPGPQQSTQPPVQQTQQYQPNQYPTTQYPATQNPATQYPSTQFPVTRYPVQQQQQQQQQQPGNLAPVQQRSVLDQLVQQAQVPTMQGYNYGQYPMVNGPSQMYPQYNQQAPPPQQQQFPPQPMVAPSPGTMYAPSPHQYMHQQPPPPPPPPQQYPSQHYQQPYEQQQPYGQNPQEKHIFYGPDGQVLPGPPPGFAYDGSVPRDTEDHPQDFSIEGVLDYGRLRAVQLMDNTKRFPKIPEYLHRELLQKYKQYSRTFVRIVSRGGQVHVHATPFVDRSPRIMEEAVRPEVKYKYVPIYVDENDQVIENPHGMHRERGRFQDRREELSRDGTSEDFYRRHDADTDEPYFRRTRHERTADTDHGGYGGPVRGDRASPRGSPRTVVNAYRPRRQELPAFDY